MLHVDEGDPDIILLSPTERELMHEAILCMRPDKRLVTGNSLYYLESDPDSGAIISYLHPPQRSLNNNLIIRTNHGDQQAKVNQIFEITYRSSM